MTAQGLLTDIDCMQRALVQARRAAAGNEVPVGAVVVVAGAVLAESCNQPIAACDPTAHAEIAALRAAAGRQSNYRLAGATLYATLEPCAMCVGAALQARVRRLVFGAWDPKAGACGSVVDLPRELGAVHRMDVFGGVCADECGDLLRRFFEARR